MKKRLTLIIIVSLLMFNAASPWEGAAAVAPNGELPSIGFYIATNAFPRNTVVDITNIETGKSTRAIISNSLTGPGLLAIVSREAAELIGMRAGSVSRIRIVQPADPMAYMRFIENMAAGTPEYDSGNVIDEENLLADVYGDDTYTPPDNINQISETQPKPPAVSGYIVNEPEWGGSGRLQIVDVPGFLVEPVEQFTEQPPVTQIPPVREQEYIDEPKPVKQTTHISDQKKESKQEIKEPLNYITEHSQRDIAKDVSPIIDEKPRTIEKDAPEYIPELPRKEVVKDVPVFTEAPRNEVVNDVPPSQEKAEVVTAPPAQQQVRQPEAVQAPPEQQILVPVETAPNPPPSNSSTVYGINPEDIMPSIVAAAPERIPERNSTPVKDNRPMVLDSNFSVKTIDRLDRGKYYVQIAAISADSVEYTLKQIDRSFAPVVFKGTNNMYNILIGPLNQGESAAVLARFKSIGYKDAFVRIGG